MSGNHEGGKREPSTSTPYALRFVGVRLTILIGFAGMVGFGLVALYPGGSRTLWLLVSLASFLVTVTALIYLVTAHRRALRSEPRRPEDADGD
jgi:hypothetical protein